jgi:two-component system response regulator HydG
MTLAEVEAEALRITLRLTGGNRSAAARILSISRPTIHRKIRDYGLEDTV